MSKGTPNRPYCPTGVAFCNPTLQLSLRGLRRFVRGGVRGKGRLRLERHERQLREADRSIRSLGGGADEAFERDSQFPMQSANHLQG